MAGKSDVITAIAEQAGISNFKRVPALNSDPAFVGALADIVQEAVG